MMNESLCMWRRLALLGLVLVSGCTTKANPRSCNDGICNDQAFPFCDVDGKFGGKPGECIAVACTPEAFFACEGDTMLRCNSEGNDYDSIQCERGCDAATMGCLGCAANDQCGTAAPVCDLDTNTCRRCETDDECDSRVCNVDTGACVATSQVVYSSPTGPNTGECLLESPCSMAHAVTIASADPLRSAIRMLPGVYTDLPTISGTIAIVGTGATVQNASFFIGADAKVNARGLKFDVGTLPITCSRYPATGARPTLQLRDATVISGRIDIDQCDGRLLRVHGADEASFSSSSFEIDQSELGQVTFRGSSQRVKVMNSLMTGIHLSALDEQTTQSRLEFAFNTIHYPSEFYLIDCSSTNQGLVAVFQNNIVSGGPADVVRGTRCSFANNVLFPQATALSGTNIVMDPKFVNAATGDLHLQASSPAVDAATPSTGLAPTVDFEGTARPQGAKLDIGAFERTP